MTPSSPSSLPPGIRRRGSGYLATVYAGTDVATGKKTTISRTFTDKAKALTWQRRTRADVKADRRKSPVSLRDLLRRWVDHKQYEYETGEITANTFHWYESAVESHLLPSPIASRSLRDITRDDLRRFLSHKRASGNLNTGGPLGQSSVRRLSVILDASFSWAVAERWTDTNPMDGISLGPKMGSDRATNLEWTTDTLRTFLDFHRADRFYAAWRLLAVTGLRRGELLALKWSDLRTPDIGIPAVIVRRSMTVVNGRPVVKEPKTVESGRTVPIDDETMAVLESSHARENQEREQWGAAYLDEGWVFCRENGTPYLPDYFTKRTKTACVEAGVPVISPHAFRHLTATLLLEANVPTKVVSDLLGHSSTAITADIYQTARESAAREAVGHISEGL